MSLGNVLVGYLAQPRVSFLRPGDEDLFRELAGHAFEVQVRQARQQAATGSPTGDRSTDRPTD